MIVFDDFTLLFSTIELNHSRTTKTNPLSKAIERFTLILKLDSD